MRFILNKTNNNTFEKYKRFNPDTGIGSYIDENIEIIFNNYGFYEEQIIDANKNIDDNVLLSSTHYPHSIKENELSSILYSKVNNIKFNDRIGYYKDLYIGHVIDSNLRNNSSSGGFGTWILKELFVNDLIDGVIHVGTGHDHLFEYKISRSINEINNNSKTRYYPVELSKVLKEVKEIPGRYALVGIPSFISSVRLLQEIDPIIKERIIYTIGLVCGHQKGSGFTEYMGWQNGIKPDDLSYIDYRVKIKGLPSNKYGIRIKGLKDGKSIDQVVENYKLEGQNWGKGYFKKEESDFVDDVFNECADITLGDAWLKKYNEDYKGNNIIIIRNETISKIVEKGIEDNKLKIDISNENEIIESQIAHISHTQNDLAYRINKFSKGYIVRRDYNQKITTFRKVIQQQRHIISRKSNVEFYNAKLKDDLQYFENKMKRNNLTYDYLYRVQNYTKRLIKKLFK